ncbi:transposase family protein (plasmid) [Brucella sp. 6810]|nr:transposase family protein [Brucella sp. 6810]
MALFPEENQRHARPVPSLDAIIVAAYGRSQDCTCPHCRTASRRVHSRYRRMIADLPCVGRKIELHLTAYVPNQSV